MAKAGEELLVWFLVELAKALLSLLKAAIIWYLNARFNEFAAATRNAACGVTLTFTFNHPGLRVLHVLLDKRLPSWADVRTAARALMPPSVTIVPGFTRR